jgi:hypothetical protein
MISWSSPIPQWIADLQGRKMLDANEPALQFWGMTREQFLTAECDKFFHPEEMPRWESYIQEGRWGESGPWKCTRGDGTIFYCTVRWHMMECQGIYAALVFPLRAGTSPDTMIELDFKPQETSRRAGA